VIELYIVVMLGDDENMLIIKGINARSYAIGSGTLILPMEL
jgi:hypothetical protein